MTLSYVTSLDSLNETSKSIHSFCVVSFYLSGTLSLIQKRLSFVDKHYKHLLRARACHYFYWSQDINCHRPKPFFRSKGDENAALSLKAPQNVPLGNKRCGENKILYYRQYRKLFISLSIKTRSNYTIL